MNNFKSKKFGKSTRSVQSNPPPKQNYKKYGKAKVCTGLKSKRGLKKVSINSLPNELLLKTFSLLPIDALQNVSLVCRRWRDLANDNGLWEQHFQYFFGVGSLYIRLKNLSLNEAKVSMYWKKEFFQQCQIHTKKLLSKQKKNQFTNITDNVGTILSTYGITFELLIIDKNEKELSYPSALRQSNRTSSFLQWNSLTGFPPLETVQKILVLVSTPLLLKKEKKNLPRKTSLICTVELPKKSFKEDVNIIGNDSQHQIELKLISGMLFATWSDSNDIAFISICLHHHNLINKCLLSSYEKTFSVVHKPIPDDVDTRYGMYGYQCHILVHTAKKTLWEQKFSYLSCSKEAGDGYLLMKPDQYADTFNYADFVWKTELFSGKFQEVVIVDITMTDSNAEIIWAQSYPIKAKRTSTRDVVLEHSTSDSLYVLQHQDDIGLFSVVFCKEDSSFTPNVVLGISFPFLSKWFGIKC